jgi:hypothetical protein
MILAYCNSLLSWNLPVMRAYSHDICLLWWSPLIVFACYDSLLSWYLLACSNSLHSLYLPAVIACCLDFCLL